MRRRLLTAVAAVAVAAALAACDDEASGGSGASIEDGASSETVVAGLCRAAASAGAGDVAGAGAGFADVHASLHDLADGLGGDGAGRRADAARLLEAKQRVEAALEAGEGPRRLAGDLHTLAAIAGDVTGEPVPARCG